MGGLGEGEGVGRHGRPLLLLQCLQASLHRPYRIMSTHSWIPAALDQHGCAQHTQVAKYSAHDAQRHLGLRVQDEVQQRTLKLLTRAHTTVMTLIETYASQV